MPALFVFTGHLDKFMLFEMVFEFICLLLFSLLNFVLLFMVLSEFLFELSAFTISLANIKTKISKLLKIFET